MKMNLVEHDGAYWRSTPDGYTCTIELTVTEAELANSTRNEAAFRAFYTQIPALIANALSEATQKAMFNDPK